MPRMGRKGRCGVARAKENDMNDSLSLNKTMMTTFGAEIADMICILRALGYAEDAVKEAVLIRLGLPHDFGSQKS